MSKRPLLPVVLTVVLLVALCQTALCSWNSAVFNGQEFLGAKQGGYPLIRHRSGFLPFVDYSGNRPNEAKLADGSGAIAGICYIQSSGGKAHALSGFIPMAGEPVELHSGKTVLTIRSDAAGYFLLAVPEGSYEIKVRGISRKISVEKGKTVFVPMRGGKRMVD